MSKNTVLFDDTVNTLRRLKQDGFNTGIVTTKYHYRIIETLDLHSVLDLIDIIVGREDVKVPKPSPEGLLLAIDSLNAQLNDVLYIGDSLVDAKTALAAHVVCSSNHRNNKRKRVFTISVHKDFKEFIGTF